VVGDYGSLQFEYEQQDEPRAIVDRGRIGVDEFAQCDAARIQVRCRRRVLSPEDEPVQAQKRVGDTLDGVEGDWVDPHDTPLLCEGGRRGGSLAIQAPRIQDCQAPRT
jgi:hypothetical protein